MLKKIFGITFCIVAFAMSAEAQTVTGSGTANTVPVFTGTSTVGNSPITVSGSNVWIGATSPASLGVTGSIALTGTSGGGYPGGTLGALTIGGTGSSWSVIQAQSGTLAINQGGWANVVIPSGNIGIGTTTPAYKLDVAGAIHTSTGGIIFPDGTTQTTANANVVSGTNQITQLGGNVGIGTLWPGSKLQVYAPPALPSITAQSGEFRLGDSTGTSTGLNIGQLPAWPWGTWLQVTNEPASYGGAWPLLLNPLGGNVGIGTTTPNAPLTVVSSNSASNVILADFLDASLPNGGLSQIQFGQSQTTNADGTLIYTYNGTTPALSYSSLGTYGNSFTLNVNGAGNVGIGTTTPAYKLDVAGPIHSSTGGFVFPDGTTQTTASANVVSGTNQITQVNGGVGIGTTTPLAKLDITGGTSESLHITNNNQSPYAIMINNATFGATDVKGFGLWQGDTGTAFITNNNVNAVAFAPTGNIGIGTTTPGAKLEVAGNLKLTANSGASITFADGSTQTTAYTGTTCTGADYAEAVDVTGDRTKYEPGDLLVLDPNAPGKFLKSNQAYSTLVAGIYSTKPGFVGRKQPATPETNAAEVPLAMVGRVPTKVSAENGPIKVGDLLVTSSTTGYAMKGTDRSQMLGAVVGKAMGSLDSGTGVIEVLVTLQ